MLITDKRERKSNDPRLDKKEQQKALVAKSEHNQLEIKKNVAIATLKDMKNKEEMLNQQMQETIEER